MLYLHIESIYAMECVWTENSPDNHIHAIWYKTPIKYLWQQAASQLSLLLSHPIPLSPSLCLLRDTPEINITLYCI